MEKGNMLSLERVKRHLNGILPDAHKLWAGIIDEIIDLGYKRLCGCYRSELDALSGKPLGDAKKKAIACVEDRLAGTIQYRHDWAHNCGMNRPGIAGDSIC